MRHAQQSRGCRSASCRWSTPSQSSSHLDGCLSRGLGQFVVVGHGSQGLTRWVCPTGWRCDRMVERSTRCCPAPSPVAAAESPVSALSSEITTGYRHRRSAAPPSRRAPTTDFRHANDANRLPTGCPVYWPCEGHIAIAAIPSLVGVIGPLWCSVDGECYLGGFHQHRGGTLAVAAPLTPPPTSGFAHRFGPVPDPATRRRRQPGQGSVLLLRGNRCPVSAPAVRRHWRGRRERVPTTVWARRESACVRRRARCGEPRIGWLPVRCLVRRRRAAGVPSSAS